MSIDVSTRGDRIELSTGDHRLVISACGGRILEYSVGGHNVLSTSGDWVQRGSTFWLGPHHRWPTIWPPDPALDDEPYAFSIERGAVTLSSPPVSSFGVRVRKRIEMTEHGDLLLEYRVRPLEEVRWSPWEVTRLRPGLCFFGTGRHRDAIVDPEVDNVQAVVDGEVTWVPFEVGNSRFRTYLGDADGWCGYAGGGLLLLKHFPKVCASEFPERNGSLKIWWQNSDFIELEQLGPCQVMKPDQDTVYRTRWSLARLPPGVLVGPRSASLRAWLPACRADG